MRQTAGKLEKGKWYADIRVGDNATFLKFHHASFEMDCFSSQTNYEDYSVDPDGFIRFTRGVNSRFIPTTEDRGKYNLIDE